MSYLLEGVTLQGSARIDPTARLCVWSEQRTLGIECPDGIGSSSVPEPVLIGDQVVIGGYASVYEGAVLAPGVIVEDYCRVGPHSRIGRRTRLCYSSHISDSATIGSDCVIAGFVCDGAVVGDSCRIFGALVHEQSQPHMDWWVVNESPPTIHDGTTIGWGAIIVGGISVGPNAYVAAGAIVTKDVPEGVIVTGVNKVTRRESWLGRRLTAWVAHIRGRQ